MDNVQNCVSYINIPSTQTRISCNTLDLIPTAEKYAQRNNYQPENTKDRNYTSVRQTQMIS
jgi:hypothetical protein